MCVFKPTVVCVVCKKWICNIKWSGWVGSHWETMVINGTMLMIAQLPGYWEKHQSEQLFTYQIIIQYRMVVVLMCIYWYSKCHLEPLTRNNSLLHLQPCELMFTYYVGAKTLRLLPSLIDIFISSLHRKSNSLVYGQQEDSVGNIGSIALMYAKLKRQNGR